MSRAHSAAVSDIVEPYEPHRRSPLSNLSATIQPRARQDGIIEHIGRWNLISMWLLTMFLVVFAFMLSPLMVSGDGANYSARALYAGFLTGIEPRHPLATIPLRTIYVVLRAVQLDHYSLKAFVAVSSLSTAGTFLLLAWSVYPRFIRSRIICLISALGAFMSYGVLSRAAAVEVYGPALFLDVALVAYCLRSPFEKARHAIFAGVLLVLAVGFHVTNVLIVPAVIAIVTGRIPRERILRVHCWAGSTFLVGMGALVFLLWLGPGGMQWPPDPAKVFPQNDPQPPMGPVGHLSRAVYGFARSLAFLPYHRDLGASLATGYVVGASGAIILLVYVGRGGLVCQWDKNRRLFLTLVLLATPFICVGIWYYPSDPERWLFLTPPLWLTVGMAWDQFIPPLRRRSVVWESPIVLGAIVVGLGIYNAAALLPDALGSRALEGLRYLSKLTTRDDLVISPAGTSGRLMDFYLDRRIQGQDLTAWALSQKHGADLGGIQSDLAQQIDRALQQGRRVFVFGFIGERHEKHRGHPWAHMLHGCGPETFSSVLEQYRQDPIYPSTSEHIGTIRLEASIGSSDPPVRGALERAAK
jgi:hypothetical protein